MILNTIQAKLKLKLGLSLAISATFVSHLVGLLYDQIIDERGTFSLQMNISGEATGAGKSLLHTIWMRVFEGQDITPLTSISEALIYT